VAVRDGEMLVSDGPFAETKEVICGYDVLECGSLEEAVLVAAAHPVAGVRQDRGQAVLEVIPHGTACTARRRAWTAVASRPKCTALVSRTSHRPVAGSKAGWCR